MHHGVCRMIMFPQLSCFDGLPLGSAHCVYAEYSFDTSTDIHYVLDEPISITQKFSEE